MQYNSKRYDKCIPSGGAKGRRVGVACPTFSIFCLPKIRGTPSLYPPLHTYYIATSYKGFQLQDYITIMLK